MPRTILLHIEHDPSLRAKWVTVKLWCWFHFTRVGREQLRYARRLEAAHRRRTS